MAGVGRARMRPLTRDQAVQMDYINRPLVVQSVLFTLSHSFRRSIPLRAQTDSDHRFQTSPQRRASIPSSTAWRLCRNPHHAALSIILLALLSLPACVPKRRSKNEPQTTSGKSADYYFSEGTYYWNEASDDLSLSDIRNCMERHVICHPGLKPETRRATARSLAIPGTDPAEAFPVLWVLIAAESLGSKQSAVPYDSLVSVTTTLFSDFAHALSPPPVNPITAEERLMLASHTAHLFAKSDEERREAIRGIGLLGQPFQGRKL